MGTLTSYDYTAVAGPTWSPVIVMGLGTALAYLVKETAFGRFLRDHGQPEAAELIAGKPE